MAGTIDHAIKTVAFQGDISLDKAARLVAYLVKHGDMTIDVVNGSWKVKHGALLDKPTVRLMSKNLERD